MVGFARFLVFVLVGAVVVGAGYLIHPELVALTGALVPSFVAFGRRVDLAPHLADALTVVLPMAGALLAEWLSTAGRHSSLTTMFRLGDASTRKDLAFVLLAVCPFALPLLNNLLTFGFVAWATHWVREHGPAGLNLFDHSVQQVGWVATVSLFYLSTTLFDYLSHRLLHTPVGWPLHRMHHAATTLTPATALRDHPADQVLAPLANTLPMLLWAPPDTFVHLFLIGYAYQVMFAHTQADIEWGWIGRHVFPAPVVHKLHHSIAHEDLNHNYSANLLLWDRLFGTFRYAAKVPRVGIAGPQGEQRPLAAELVGDLRDFGQALARHAPRWRTRSA